MERKKPQYLKDDYEDLTEDEQVDALEDHSKDEDMSEDPEEMQDPWEREMARKQQMQTSKKYSVWE